MMSVNNLGCESLSMPSSISFSSSTQGIVILNITYGIPVLPDNDPNVEIAEKAMKSLFFALMPGAFLVVSVYFRTLSLTKIGLGPDSFVEICAFLVPRCRIQA